MSFCVFTLFALCVATGNGARTSGSLVPPWVTVCYRDDPKFDECSIVNGQKAIPHLVKGERRIRLPVLDPLQIVEISLQRDVTKLGLDIVLRDVAIRGFKDTVIKTIHTDLQDQRIVANLLVPKLEILSTYNVSGQILVLPITGHGPGKISLDNVFVVYAISYNLVMNDKDGKNYMTVRDYSLTFNTTRVHVQLDNLFNGDKLLGATMNQFLNDNWKELVRSIGPGIANALSDVVIQIFQVITDIVSYDDIMPLSPKK